MGTSIALTGLFGIGVLLILKSQPIGRPRPSIGQRLDALRADKPKSQPVVRRVAFRTAILEEILRPTMESAGEMALRITRRLGLDLAETSSRLAAVGDEGGLGLFLGQKVASAVLGVAFLPMASALGGLPSTPSWMWLVLGAGGFLLPDMALRSKAETRRRELKEELARFAELTSLSVSAGQGLESALDRVSQSSDGPFFEHLKRALRETRLHGEPASSALSRLATELRLTDAEPLASALRAAEEHGIQVSQVLRTQARAIRERRRIELIEIGERAPARMALPIGLLILPAFFIVILYPAAVQLLRVTAR
ncbi:MAG: type II secretion system F family protein [Actinomycetota bacterium]